MVPTVGRTPVCRKASSDDSVRDLPRRSESAHKLLRIRRWMFLLRFGSADALLDREVQQKQ